MSLPSQSRISFARINENVRFTGGNFGINTTNPTSTLDVSGTARITTSITSEAVYATNSTVTNSVSTNTSSGTLNLSTGITSASAQMANLVSTNSTMTNLRSTLSSIGTLRTDLGVMTEGLMVKASISTSLTVPNLLVTTSVSSGAVYATNSTVTNFVATSNTVGTSIITTSLLAIGNSNTVGNIFTTGGNVGIGTSAPGSYKLHVVGDINYTGSLYQNGAIFNGSSQWLNNGSNIYFSTGNVGIGTSNPSTRLNVSGDTVIQDGSLVVKNAPGGWTGFELQGTGGSFIDFGPDTIDFRSRLEHTESDRSLRFRVNGGTYAMTLASTGNVGIGTNTPSTKLNVSGSTDLFGNLRVGGSSSSTGFNIDLGTSGAVDSFRSGYLYGDGTTIYLTNQQNGALNFGTNNTWNRLVITAAGNVGINTNSPTYRLSVSGAGGFTGNLYVNHGGAGTTPQINVSPNTNTAESSIGFWQNTNNGGAVWVIGHNPSGVGNNNFGIYSSTYGGNALSILNNGNVGIGRNNPAYKLQSTGVISVDSGSGSEARYHLYNNGGVAEWLFGQKSNSNHNFTFTKKVSTTETDYLSIGSDGRVGIGINTPANNGLQINSGELQLGPNNSNAFHIYGSGGACEFYSGSWGNGTVLGRWSTTGLGLGTFSPGVALHVKGNVNSTGQPLWLQNYFAASGVYWKIGPDGGNNNITVYNHNGLGVWMANDGTGWNAQSDIRVKKDVETLTSGLDVVDQLRPVKYRYNQDDAEKSLRIGFIAQEVRDLIPEIVGSNPTEDFPDGLLGLSLESFVPFLVNAIKDLSTELKQTKSELQQTKSDLQQIVNDLLQRIEILENQGA